MPTSGTIDNYGLRYNWGTGTLEMNTGAEVWIPVPIDITDELALTDGKILIGNTGVATQVTPSGGFTMSNLGVATLGNTAVTGQALTGFVSGAGTVSATDTILTAFNKINGNVAAKVSTTLTSAHLLVGNGSNVATDVAMSGVVTLANTGATALTGSITTSGLTQSTAKLLGRSTASTGAIEEITVGAGLTLAAGTLTAPAGASNVVQVVSSSSTAVTDATPIPTSLTASITPSTNTKKIRVTVTANMYFQGGSGEIGWCSIYRGVTNLAALGNEHALGGIRQTPETTTHYATITMQYLDSPATTSSTTYTMYIWCRSGSGPFTLNPLQTDSTIILEEV